MRCKLVYISEDSIDFGLEQSAIHLNYNDLRWTAQVFMQVSTANPNEGWLDLHLPFLDRRPWDVIFDLNLLLAIISSSLHGLALLI